MGEELVGVMDLLSRPELFFIDGITGPLTNSGHGRSPIRPAMPSKRAETNIMTVIIWITSTHDV